MLRRFSPFSPSSPFSRPLPRALTLSLALAAPLGVGTACDDAASEGEGEGEGEGECAAVDTGTCDTVVDVDCRDTVFNNLSMNLTAAAPGLIESTKQSTENGDTFDVNVDATAGGFNGDEGWVYGKFTADGLEKVDLLDDESFDSLDWDIAFRRFVIRLNSGYAGPSCVTGARTAPNTDFDALACVPDGLDFNAEIGFMSDSESCTLVADGSGLPGAPSVVLQNWWEYPAGCVATTGNVFVLGLADGSHVKLVVTQYYEGDGAQETCNETGTVAGESARIKLRYGFLP